MTILGALTRSTRLAARCPPNRLRHARYLQPIRLYAKQIHTTTPVARQTSKLKDASPEVTEPIGKPAKRKPSRSPAANASLRRVAIEAERLHERPSDAKAGASSRSPSEQETKTVTAFCAAEQYRIERVAEVLRNSGYVLDPFHTDLYPQVIHFQMPSSSYGQIDDDYSRRPQEPQGDVFVFPLGTVVAWDVEEERVRQLVSGALRHAAVNAHPESLETEDLEYLEDYKAEKSSIIGDTIRIGMGPLHSAPLLREDHPGAEEDDPALDETKRRPSSGTTTTETTEDHKQNLTLAKIAFASGLARSTKIAVLESLLDKYFANTQQIPALLSTGSRLPYNRAFMLRKAGELLSVRAQLNMTELTDRLPDLFWDSRHELGLEGYFEQVGRALDVGVRIKTLNERMDYAQEIATVLRETLSERHGLFLEWLIIGLIAVEVCVEGWKIWRESKIEADPRSMENLKRRWLLQQLGEDNDERRSS